MAANSKDNLQRLIQLAKADGGKFFVIDEQGNPHLVIMPIEEYESVLLKKVQGQIEDIEDINRKIIEAQKLEQQANRAVIQDFGNSPARPWNKKTQEDRAQAQEDLVSEVIDSTFEFEPPMPAPQDQNQNLNDNQNPPDLDEI